MINFTVIRYTAMRYTVIKYTVIRYTALLGQHGRLYTCWVFDYHAIDVPGYYITRYIIVTRYLFVCHLTISSVCQSQKTTKKYRRCKSAA